MGEIDMKKNKGEMNILLNAALSGICYYKQHKITQFVPCNR